VVSIYAPPLADTDAWGWEQILWFGMGQQLRLGLWEPGDTLPDSLIEMLTYMKEKVRKRSFLAIYI
jgi:hypothetical protein